MRKWIPGLIALGLVACAPQTPAATVEGVSYVGRSFTPTDSDGAVTVECVVQAGGSLSDCVILSEEPAGMGFGAAALQVATRARVDVSGSRAGKVGSKVRWTTRFRPG